MAAEGELRLCLVRVGPLRLLFEPSKVVHIEGVHRERADAIPTLDLRRLYEVEAGARTEALLVRQPEGRLRLLVCQIDQILRSELLSIFPLPHILTRSCHRLGLRGFVQLQDEETLAYLASPQALARLVPAEEAA